MAGIDLGDAWADEVWESGVWADGVWEGQEEVGAGGGGSSVVPANDMADPARTARIGVLGRLTMAMCITILILGAG